MEYFDGVKIGDRVWDFLFEYGEVVNIENEYFEVMFKIIEEPQKYTFDGKDYYAKKFKQRLFWDEIKFEIPKKPKVELKENKYIIEPTLDEIQVECESKARKLGFGRNNKEIAEKALKQIKRFIRLLALRDQECKDSRGYEFVEGEENYYIVKVLDNPYSDSKYKNKYMLGGGLRSIYDPDKVYFKTEEDAEKICDILNSSKFDLEEE